MTIDEIKEIIEMVALVTDMNKKETHVALANTIHKAHEKERAEDLELIQVQKEVIIEQDNVYKKLCEKELCYICKHPRNEVGSEYCSLSHPIPRDVFERELVDARINELVILFQEVPSDYLNKRIAALKQEQEKI